MEQAVQQLKLAAAGFRRAGRDCSTRAVVASRAAAAQHRVRQQTKMRVPVVKYWEPIPHPCAVRGRFPSESASPSALQPNCNGRGARCYAAARRPL